MRPRRRVATAVDRLRMARIGYVRLMARLKVILAISASVLASAFPLASAHAARPAPPSAFSPSPRPSPQPGKNGAPPPRGPPKAGLLRGKAGGKGPQGDP